MLFEKYISKKSKILEYESGEMIFSEGEEGKSFYIIISGKVAIIKKVPGFPDLTLGYKSKDDVIGEISLLADKPRSASIICVSKVSLLEIPNIEFWKLMERDKDFQEYILSTLVESIRASDYRRSESIKLEWGLFQKLNESISTPDNKFFEFHDFRLSALEFMTSLFDNPLNEVMIVLNENKSDAEKLSLIEKKLSQMKNVTEYFAISYMNKLKQNKDNKTQILTSYFLKELMILFSDQLGQANIIANEIFGEKQIKTEKYLGKAIVEFLLDDDLVGKKNIHQLIIEDDTAFTLEIVIKNNHLDGLEKEDIFYYQIKDNNLFPAGVKFYFYKNLIFEKGGELSFLQEKGIFQIKIRHVEDNQVL